MKMKRPHEKKHTETKKKRSEIKESQTSVKAHIENFNAKQYIDKSVTIGKNLLNSVKGKIQSNISRIQSSISKSSISKIQGKQIGSKLRNNPVIGKYLAKAQQHWFVLACVFLVVVVAGLGIGYEVKQAQIRHQELLEASKTYKVYVDGTYIGLVSETEVVDQYINQRISEVVNEKSLETRLGNAVTYEEYYDLESKPQDQYILEQLEGKLDFQTRTVMLYVNDNPVVRVSTEEDAEKIIENVKDTYVSHDENTKVMLAEINERVDYKVEWAAADSVKDLESATAILLKGTDKEIKHVVENGENIWVIAQKNKVTVSEIMDANPQLKSEGDIIHPGDQLSLKVPEPFVNVEVVEEIEVTEEIAFETRNVNNNKMYTWESKVQTPGVPGEREVVYRISKINGKEVSREVLSEKVTKQPVDQVVAKGTLGVPANGTGQLIWPTSGGKITSPYGGARRHSGVDIGNPTGTPIYAADDGTVVFAGWYGGYGKLVRVVHTSTMQTYYAHMSTINVQVGQKVKKGEVLGAVGSTGNSTGPHLHFEVRINGGTVNPLNYFNSR